jgi:hypothetical protein
MVIMFEAGRLGNQLFQYTAIRFYKPNEKILLVGMRPLKQVISDLYMLRDNIIWLLVERTLKAIGYECILSFAKRTKAISLATEIRDEKGSSCKIQDGCVNSLTLFEKGFYQYPPIAERVEVPEISTEVLSRAEWFLAQASCQARHLYFLHQRRGDYLAWPDAGHPAVLPQDWYEAQIKSIRRSDPDAVFAVIGDDLDYLQAVYAARRNFMVSAENEVVDLVIMSLCEGGGILSASSFSWWGAFLALRRSEGALFLAPEFWIGHTRKTWYPPYIKSSWLTYSSVE